MSKGQKSYREEDAPSFEKVWAMFQEASKQQEKYAKQQEKFAKQQEKTDKQFEETKKLIESNARETKELKELFTTQWGALIESLVEGDLIRLLSQKGIKVERTIQRASGCYQGRNFEFDIIAINGREIVVVEVKTTLRPKYIKEFLFELTQIKTWMHEYSTMKIYGAVAFLKDTSDAKTMAENKGLFVIRATGNSASIINKEDFIPRSF